MPSDADISQSTGPVSFPAEQVPARCPRCGATFGAEVVTIVDASDTRDRDALLTGSLNVVGCPSCGQPFVAEAPMLYYDTAQDIALAHMPGGLTLSREEQERAVGRLTNRVLDKLPPEQRRMYLLQPRTFFTTQTFMEAVLEANGISAEDIARARGTAELVEDLAALDGPDAIRERLEREGRAADAALAQIADALAQERAARGDSAGAARLRALRDTLVEMLGPTAITMDDLVEALVQSRAEGELDAAVAGLRPVLDYTFFAELTARIDASSGDEAAQLQALRFDLLAAIEVHDARLSAQLERAADSLNAILAAEDPADAVRRRAPALDSTFLSVLQANIRAAEADGRDDMLTRLKSIRDATYEGLEAAMLPRQRLVNRLARAEDMSGREQLLDEGSDLVDSETEDALRRAAAEAAAMGADEIAGRLLSAADAVHRRLSGAPGPDPVAG